MNKREKQIPSLSNYSKIQPQIGDNIASQLKQIIVGDALQKKYSIHTGAQTFRYRTHVPMKTSAYTI